jgi:hypothetical protein
VGSHARRDGRMQPTPLRGPEIIAILAVGFGLSAFLIYTAARLMGKPLDGDQEHPYCAELPQVSLLSQAAPCGILLCRYYGNMN